VLSLRDALGTVKLKLWDEEQNKLVSFDEAGVVPHPRTKLAADSI
jgi:hypothetical protein